MRFAVLGPLQVDDDGTQVSVTGGPERKVLGVLLSRAGDPVAAPDLVDALWPEEPPRNAVKNVQSYISRLRRDLGEQERIALGPAGYQLALGPGELDADEFAEHIEGAGEAIRAGDTGRAEQLLGEALSLWRGRPYGGLEDCAFLTPEVERLGELRLKALEDKADVGLARGRHAELIPELSALVSDQPYRERFAALLMLALFRADRQADALEVYRRTRALLHEELGVEPGQELQDLQEAILRRDPELGLGPARSHEIDPRPAQLPRDLGTFAGRRTELAELLSFATRPERNVVTVGAIDGMAGVGKTALAVHAAHRLADNFPDGQLFVNLHGFTKGVSAIQPPTALDSLLRSIGVPGDQIPNRVEDRAALWRTRCADKQFLVLLDDAASERQVQSLLPASPGCLVLVTSRRRLNDLDAHPLSLDILPVPDAVEVLTRVAGEERIANEPSELVAEAVELCGRLPLAIRLLATRLRNRPAWTLKNLVHRLRDTQNRLSELETGRSVAGAFQISYDQLKGREQRMFRLLGLHPGSDFDAYAAAALADVSRDEAEQSLELLVDVHLLESLSYGRYTFHDLLRAHATETAYREEPKAEWQAAFTRLFDYYLHTAARAMDVFAPAEGRGRPEPASSVAGPSFHGYDQAVRWLDTERANLVASAGQAAETGWSAHASGFSTTLFRYFDVQPNGSEVLELHGHALRATRAHGDRPGEARALGYLGATYRDMGEPDEALTHLYQALDCLGDDRNPDARPHGARDGSGAGDTRETDESALRATVLGALGSVLYRMGRFSAAVENCHRAAELHRATGDLAGEARALQVLGYIARERGRLDTAGAYGDQALGLARAAGDRRSEGNALNLLGGTLCRMQRYEEALGHCRRAQLLHHSTGNRMGEYVALAWMGRALLGLGRSGDALDHCRRALGIAQDIDDRNGEFEAHLGIGDALRESGRSGEAVRHLKQALGLARALRQEHDEARAHGALARAYRDLGESRSAEEHGERSLEIFVRLGVSDSAAPH